MHQHLNIIKWELNENSAAVVERYCTGCGRKVKFMDSGVRRHNANGKNLTQFAIYKCEKGHTWNQKLQNYKASVADTVSDPESLEREGYKKDRAYGFGRVPSALEGQNVIQQVISQKDEAGNGADLKVLLERYRGIDIEILGDGTFTRLDKTLADRFKGISRSRIKEAVEANTIQLNSASAKPSVKLKGGDIINIFFEAIYKL